VKRARGFSILELVVVLAIIGVFVAIGFPSFTYLSRTTQIKTASSNIYIALLRARSAAVKRNTNVVMTPAVSGQWQKGWTIFDQSNPNPPLATQEELKGVYIVPSITTQIIFSASGRVQGGVVPSFSVQQPPEDTRTFTARCITVAPNGTPYVKTQAC